MAEEPPRATGSEEVTEDLLRELESAREALAGLSNSGPGDTPEPAPIVNPVEELVPPALDPTTPTVRMPPPGTPTGPIGSPERPAVISPAAPEAVPAAAEAGTDEIEIMLRDPASRLKELQLTRAHILEMELEALRANRAEYDAYRAGPDSQSLRTADADIVRRLEALATMPEAERLQARAEAQAILERYDAFAAGMQSTAAALKDRAKFPAETAPQEPTPEEVALGASREKFVGELQNLRQHSEGLRKRFGGFWSRLRKGFKEKNLHALKRTVVFEGASLKEIEAGIADVLRAHPILPSETAPTRITPPAGGVPGAPDVPLPPAGEPGAAVAENKTAVIRALGEKGFKPEEAEALYKTLQAKAEHNAARTKCGHAMMEKERERRIAEYEVLLDKPRSEWTEEEGRTFDMGMNLHRARTVMPRIVDKEAEALKAAGIEGIPPNERGRVKKFMDWYGNVPGWKRWTISIGLSVSLALGGVMAMPGATVGAGAVAVGVRIARFFLSWGVGAAVGRWVGKRGQENILKAHERANRKIEALASQLSLENIAALDEEYAKIMNERAKVEAKALFNKILAVTGASLLTSFATGLGTSFAAHHLPESPQFNSIREAFGVDKADADTGGDTTPPGGAENTGAGAGIKAGGAAAGAKEIAPITYDNAPGTNDSDFLETASHRGDSWWRLAERQLEEHYGSELTGPHAEAQKTWIIDYLKDDLKPSNHLRLNAEVDFSNSIGDQELMNRLIENAKHLSPDKIASIEHNLGIHVDAPAGVGAAAAEAAPGGGAGAPAVPEGGPVFMNPSEAAISSPTEAALSMASEDVQNTIKHVFEANDATAAAWQDPQIRETLGYMFGIDPNALDNPLVREAILLHADKMLDPAQLHQLNELHQLHPDATSIQSISPDAAMAVDNSFAKHWIEAHPGEHIPADLADTMERLNHLRETYHLGELKPPPFLDNMRQWDHITHQYSGIKDVTLRDFFRQIPSPADLDADPALRLVMESGNKQYILFPTAGGGESAAFLNSNFVELKQFYMDNLNLNDELLDKTVGDLTQAMYGALDKQT